MEDGVGDTHEDRNETGCLAYGDVREFFDDLSSGRVVVLNWSGQYHSIHRDDGGCYWIQNWSNPQNDQVYPSQADMLETAVLPSGNRLKDAIFRGKIEAVL